MTPRFSLSTTDAMLDACAELLGEDIWFTSHRNENTAEVTTVAELFPGSRDYLNTYHRQPDDTAQDLRAQRARR